MALGSVTSLGVGSGFELQTMLEDFRAIDEQPINLKKTAETRLENQISEFDTINAKLIQLKSSALNLSLKSNFNEREMTVSDEEIAQATVQTGTELSSYSLDTQRLASKSSWQSAGVEAQDSAMYAKPITSINTSKESAVSEDSTLTFTVEHPTGTKEIQVDIAAGSSLEEIALAINKSSSNLGEDGNSYVTAGLASGDNGYYIRLSSTNEESSQNSQIVLSQGPDFIAPDLTFSYKAGAAGASTYVSVPPGATYQDVVSIVNNDKNNSSISAALINDGSSENPWSLTFTADNTGEENRIFLTNIQMTEKQGAENASLNAAFSINGFEYQRQTNDNIDDVVQGVSFGLKKVGETELTVTSSTEDLRTEIISLIDTFNELVNQIDSNSKFSTKEEENGILSDVYSVKSIPSTLLSLFSTSINTGGEITSIFNLGLDINKDDGSITLDEKKLDEAFNSAPDEVADLFLGNTDKEIKGLADILNDSLQNMTNSFGIMNTEKSAAEAKMDRLQNSIEEAETRLDKKYEILAEDFVRLDSFIGQMNNQSDYLKSVIDSFNNSQE